MYDGGHTVPLVTLAYAVVAHVASPKARLASSTGSSDSAASTVQPPRPAAATRSRAARGAREKPMTSSTFRVEPPGTAPARPSTTKVGRAPGCILEESVSRG